MRETTPSPLSPMTVAGIMSGTSADGIDVAIVRIAASDDEVPHPRKARVGAADADGRRLELLHHHAEPFTPELRRAVMDAMDAQQTSAAELARLHWRLGLAYAEAAQATLAAYGRPVELIGCHGQTLYHQGAKAAYAGREFACTWQLGEASLIASACGVPVVANFRPADMAAGGQGAPLVPYLDYALFRHPTRNRVLQNLGGIGNLTAIPAGAKPSEILAFDMGPANMIVDALMRKLFARPYDEGGEVAARGSASAAIVAERMQDAFFHRPPPKSAGREQFGERYADDFLRACNDAGLSQQDAIATATAFTVESIRAAVERFVAPGLATAPTDYIVAGGGSRNATLMRLLAEALAPYGFATTATDAFGLPSQAKEAAAFALLAYETWHHRPSNVPAATGASRPAILGQVTYGG